MSVVGLVSGVTCITCLTCYVSGITCHVARVSPAGLLQPVVRLRLVADGDGHHDQAEDGEAAAHLPSLCDQVTIIH